MEEFIVRKKPRVKKLMVTVMAGISMLGVGVVAGNLSSYEVNQPVIAHADSYPTIHAKVLVGNKMRDITFGSWGASPVPNSKGVVTRNSNLKGFVNSPNISGYKPNVGWVNFYYTTSTKTTKLLNKLYYTKIKGVAVTYKTQKLTKQVKLAPGHDFYNYISGSKYTAKRLHYGKTYAGKTITIDEQGIKKGMKTPYYRCYYKGKEIGWIYYSAVVNSVKYTKIKKTATVISNPKNDFYNHVTSSIYATKRLHYGKTYKNKKVTINDKAVRVGTKTPYYRCYINGKEIGWIYGGALKNIK